MPRFFAKRLATPIAGVTALVAILLASLLTAAPAAAAESAAPAAPDWLEPHGVNIVDLVGDVPDTALKDMIVMSWTGIGLALYESGERNGDTVTVRVRFVSKNDDRALCLGIPARSDTWPSTMPAATLRLFADDVDVTAQVVPVYDYFPAVLEQPIANSSGNNARYQEIRQAQVTFDGTGAIVLPANMGCWMALSGTSGPLIGEFTFNLPRTIKVTVLGEQSDTFQSYIGPGNAGQIESLRQQMARRYSNRHDDMTISAPDGAEFVIVKFPPTPVDPYVDPTSPASGTYRIRRADGKLSTDNQNSIAMPLYGQWIDADQAPGTDFLPFFDQPKSLSSPEYFVPAGVSYDTCMTNGGCPNSLLDTIYNTEMQWTAYYLSIERTRNGYTQIPLAAVGPVWQPGTNPGAAAAAARQAAPYAVQETSRQWFDFAINLPFLSVVETLAVDNPAGCPCGWFDANGRMVDYVAGE